MGLESYLQAAAVAAGLGGAGYVAYKMMPTTDDRVKSAESNLRIEGAKLKLEDMRATSEAEKAKREAELTKLKTELAAAKASGTTDAAALQARIAKLEKINTLLTTKADLKQERDTLVDGVNPLTAEQTTKYDAIQQKIAAIEEELKSLRTSSGGKRRHKKTHRRRKGSRRRRAL